jgi:hypothetical protein
MKFQWMKFYPADWIADLGHHPLEFEGAWIRICAHIQRRGSLGSLEMPLNQWAVLLGVDETKCKTLLQYVTLSETGNVTDCNGKIKITCRRLEREARQQVAGYDRVKKYRMKRKCNKSVTQGETVQKSEVEVEVRSKNKEVILKKDNTYAPSDKKTDRSGAEATPPLKNKIVIPKIDFDFEKRAWVGITNADYEDWEAAFPAVNIDQELGRMIAWLLANPEKRKLRYRKFITNWLSRTQDKGGNSWKN